MTNKKYSFLFHSSYITIKINKSGNQNIFFDGFIQADGVIVFTKPKEIHINNVRQDNVQNNYNFEKGNNMIKLI